VTRFVLGELRRYAIIVLAVICILAGIVIAPLPLPLGIPLILVGISLLIIEVPFMRRQFLALRKRYNRLDKFIDSIEHRLPERLRKALSKDDHDQPHNPA
jgi:hypothetical protein